MSDGKIKIILISGLPGVGKTTLVKKLCNDLNRHGKNGQGFYTEEVRNLNNIRIGFNVATLDGKITELSRIQNDTDSQSNPKIGKYSVFVNKFESTVISLFKEKTDFILIDEIGKMELLSRKFENQIRQMFLKEDSKERLRLIATIPIQKKNTFKIIEELKALEHTKMFEINKNNRTEIYKEIYECCFKMFLS